MNEPKPQDPSAPGRACPEHHVATFGCETCWKAVLAKLDAVALGGPGTLSTTHGLATSLWGAGCCTAGLADRLLGQTDPRQAEHSPRCALAAWLADNPPAMW